MVFRAALLCALALVGLAGCGKASSAEPEARTITVTTTPTADAASTPTEDPRCVEARSAVAGQLETFWIEDVISKQDYTLFDMALGAMTDLTNLTKNQLSTYDCVNGQYANLVDSLSQVDQDSPLFEQQKAQVLRNIQAMQ